ncbi:hypothetical protein C7212DRAFT_342065 [Tuber magnatum]|uniref:Apple domain-containing protein n=1 Tax=Tuber magnatum TaxID=42249 RepID=A0A317T0X6_9PEZI|nr:hypothetical protein C7212DRAFT_342065 [Tuber magnatum]
MQHKLISALLALSAATAVQGTPVSGSCNADNVLRALRRFSSQAIPFCSSYINVPTVTTSTTYTVGTITTTSTATLVINKRQAEEDIVVFGLANGGGLVERRNDPAPALPSYVSQYPPERVSSACSCMTIPTLTATATVPVTATATETKVVTGGNCQTTYNTAGNGVGNKVDVLRASSGQDCCEKCHAKLNCIASAFVGDGTCQHLINVQPAPGEPVTAMCPLGTKDYHFGAPKPGLVYAGPCGH